MSKNKDTQQIFLAMFQSYQKKDQIRTFQTLDSKLNVMPVNLFIGDCKRINKQIL